jgi:hypothetical protein
LGDPLKGNLLLLYKPLHLEAQQVSTRIEVRRHQDTPRNPKHSQMILVPSISLYLSESSISPEVAVGGIPS